MASRRDPPSYEKRLLMPAVAAGFLSAIVALSVSTVIHLLIMPPTGWSEDTTFRANVFWLVEWIVRRCVLFYEKGSFSIPDAIRHGLNLASFDFEARFDIADQLLQRFRTIGASGLAAGLITGCIVASESRKVDTRTHRKGRLYLLSWAGIASAVAHLNSEIRSHGAGMLLAPGITLSKARELRNILLVGAPGSGKTRIILFLIEQILRRIRDEPHTARALIHDTTGEIYAGLPLTDKEFAVLGLSRKTGWAWAMGRDIRSMADATTLAQRLIRPNDAGGENRVFDAGAVVCMTGCIALANARHRSKWGPAELLAIVLENPLELRQAFTKVYPAAAALLIVEPETGALNRTSASFVLSFQAHVLTILQTLASAWAKIPPERHFSFIDWLDGAGSRPGVVILQRSARHAALSAMWMGAVLDLIAAHACDEAYNRDRRMRIHLVLDEFYQLGDLQGQFQQVLDVGRNKNISTIAAFQDFNQARLAGGEDRAKAFQARFATKIIGQMPEGPDATEASELIGERVILTAPQKPGEPPPEESVPIVDPDIIASDFGIVDGEVRAAVLGLGNVAELSWPITVWRPVR